MEGSEAEKYEASRDVASQIYRRLQAFMSLPFEEPDRRRLVEGIGEID